MGNAGFGPDTKVCVFLQSQQNLLDFALAKKKKKQNKKLLLSARPKVRCIFAPHCT